MHISVTAVATDNAVTTLSVATTFTVMCTLLLHECEHSCQLSLLLQLSVVTAVTVLSVPPLSHCCQLSPMSC